MRCDTMCTCAGFRPSRLAVTVIVPGVSVERTATRLIPQFGVQIKIVGRIDLAAVVSAAPDARAGAGKVDPRIVGRTALSFGVDHFEIDQRDVLAVGLQSLGPTIGVSLIAAGAPAVVNSCCAAMLAADSCPRPSGCPETNSTSREGEDISVVRLRVHAERLAVDEQFDRLRIRDHVNRLHRLRSRRAPVWR